ncbi:hypothetical protein PIB30_108534, partial [Stylosanthes scabra]|nr:hypothetical protein [Stylosanthes scabra]
MGKVETLRKIFVPVNEDNVHWYLVVFDMHEGQMLWLDSKPDPNKMETKDYNIRKMVDDTTRMRIALDLVIKPYNIKQEVILKAAGKNYKKIEEKNKNLVK